MKYIQLKEPINLSKHLLVRQAQELVNAIEAQGCSPENTTAVIHAGYVKDLLWCLCEGIKVNEDGSTEYPTNYQFMYWGKH